jgi:uncharacterized protein YodC (DUF2158 family)
MSNKSKFQIGDVVRLRSTRRLMTVGQVENENVQCDWFDDEAEPQQQWFSAESLESQAG